MDEEIAPEEHDAAGAFTAGPEAASPQTVALTGKPLATQDDPSQPTEGVATPDPRVQARRAYRVQHARTVAMRHAMEEWWEQERCALARQEYARRAPLRPLAPVRPQILVVSRVEETRDELAAFLAREGYTARIAGDRDEALRIVAQTVPTLVLWELPVALWDNRGLVAALRERGIAAPVLLFVSSPSGKAWAKHVGAAGVVNRPLEHVALRTLIAGMMSAME